MSPLVRGPNPARPKGPPSKLKELLVSSYRKSLRILVAKANHQAASPGLAFVPPPLLFSPYLLMRKSGGKPLTKPHRIRSQDNRSRSVKTNVHKIVYFHSSLTKSFG